MSTRTALLVIDCQSVFEPMIASVAVPDIKRLHNHFEATSLSIIYTQHGHTKEELTPPYKNQLGSRWIDSPRQLRLELIPELKTLAEQYPKVQKNTYDAFINTDLASILVDRKIGRVVVCGVMTDCCCDTTARSAFNRGYETWLVSDACGSANKTQHQAGLRGFGFAFGETPTTAEAIKMLEEDVQ
ncbi:hypothetical protein D0863_01024 [Hortaea werneckii]|uniref:Isochorismatase-like domain-containing protein n=1 Tax=Hortaea werneckii TaxID=91943 RepID=A0A3M7EN23_HORWE|nr:hypothetical protein D0863_01024 [Hortaea werneckii]